MRFRLYLLDVSELEDDNLRQRALLLMDSYRREKVCKYKMFKDQLHQIATGLLLQVGLLELEIPAKEVADEAMKWENKSIRMSSDDKAYGKIFLCQAGAVVCALEERNRGIQRSGHPLQSRTNIPVEALYITGPDGKPYWQQDFLENLPFKKNFTHFGISHSGEYAALAVSDTEMGLDIQKEQETRFEGGCRAFCRMEAYVKCTGEGYAKGYGKYKEADGQLEHMFFCNVEVIPDHIIYVCYFM